VARAQVAFNRGVVDRALPCDSLPYDLMPTRRFTDDQFAEVCPSPALSAFHICAGALEEIEMF